MPNQSKKDPLLDSLVEDIQDDIDDGAVNHLLSAKLNTVKPVTNESVNAVVYESELREKHEKVAAEAEALKAEIALRNAHIDTIKSEIEEQQKKLADIENQAQKYSDMGKKLESQAIKYETELKEFNIQIAEHENKHKEQDRLIYGSKRPVEEIVDDIRQNEALLQTSGIEHGRYRIIKDRIFRLRRELDIAQSTSIHQRTIFDVDEFEMLKDKLPELKNSARETGKKITETTYVIKQYRELHAKCLQEAENLRSAMTRLQEEMATINTEIGPYQKQLLELLYNLETMENELSGLSVLNTTASRPSSIPKAHTPPLQTSGKMENVSPSAQGEDPAEVTELKNRHDEWRSKVDALSRRKSECLQKVKDEMEAVENFRKMRDYHNAQVRELKEKKDGLNRIANKAFGDSQEMHIPHVKISGRSLNELRREIDHLEFKQQTEVFTTEKEYALINKISELKDEFKKKKEQLENRQGIRASYERVSGRSLNEIRREIDHLEFKQQTEVLTTEKERILQAKISELREEYQREKEQLGNRQEFRESIVRAKELRNDASEIHNQVKSHAVKAEEEHDKMEECFKTVKKLKAEVEAINKELTLVQNTADEYNRILQKEQKNEHL